MVVEKLSLIEDILIFETATAAALAVTAAPPSASPQRKQARLSREVKSLTPEPGWNFLEESI